VSHEILPASRPAERVRLQSQRPAIVRKRRDNLDLIPRQTVICVFAGLFGDLSPHAVSASL